MRRTAILWALYACTEASGPTSPAPEPRAEHRPADAADPDLSPLDARAPKPPPRDAAPPPDAAPDAGPDAGAAPAPRCAQIAPAPLQRLTARQYRATVAALFPDAPTVALAPGEGPFIPQLAVEKFATAAREIAAAVDVSRWTACADQAGCAQAFVGELAPAAFRRAATPAELAWLGEVFAAAPEQLGFTDRVRLVVEVVLQSPQFLYHVETAAPTRGAWSLLDPESIAARLAYAITDAPPDAELVAHGPALLDPDVLAAEAHRLAATPAGRAKRLRFFHEWLALDALDDVVKVDPAFTPALRRSIRAEAEAFIEYAVLERGTLEALLVDPHAQLDEATAALYGGEPGWVELDPDERAGFLTRAAFLATRAGPQVKSPIHRGAFIRDRLLCAPLPPPPPTVNDAPIVRGGVEDDGDPVSLRALTERRTAGPDCAACHALINPVGFTLQRFDALGRYVDEEHGVDGDGLEYTLAIDASGALPGTDVARPIVGGVELSNALAGSAQVSDCVVDRWFESVFARAQHPNDRCVVAGLRAEFRASGGDFDALLEATVRSDAFRGRTP